VLPENPNAEVDVRSLHEVAVRDQSSDDLPLLRGEEGDKRGCLGRTWLRAPLPSPACLQIRGEILFLGKGQPSVIASPCLLISQIPDLEKQNKRKLYSPRRKSTLVSEARGTCSNLLGLGTPLVNSTPVTTAGMLLSARAASRSAPYLWHRDVDAVDGRYRGGLKGAATDEELDHGRILLSDAQLDTRAALNAHVGVGCVRALLFNVTSIQRSSCRHAGDDTGVKTYKTKHIGWPPGL